jgi:hypothetical protein
MCLVQPQDPSGPHWSPDGFWWWDGRRWVAAAQAPMPPPPGVPPGYYEPPPSFEWKPSPGLRPFLLVMLSLQVLVVGVFLLAGVIAVSTGDDDSSSMNLLAIVAVLFTLAVVSMVAVLVRARWARWVALASGIGMSLTCLGAVIGIPIIVAAARAPLSKPTTT